MPSRMRRSMRSMSSGEERPTTHRAISTQHRGVEKRMRDRHR